jgi:uncharacterized membrane protein (DUF106 family)
MILTVAIVAFALLTISLAMLPNAPVSAQVVLQQGTGHVLQSATTNSTATTTNSTTTNSTGAPPFGLGVITTPIVAYVKQGLAPYIGNPPVIPLSTFFTIGIATCMALISSTAAKLLVDYDMVRSTMKEVQAWQKELNAARKAKDDQTLAKLTKKQAAMMKQQSRASMEQMKVTAVTFVPFLLIWYLLNAVLGPATVAYSPFPLPFVGATLRFYVWYILCSFSMNLPLMRIFGIGMSEN